jgi:7-cyano-7-deazaguanine synthase
MNRAAQLCDWHPVQLLRPFVHMDKGDIARRGYELGVPFELTWTCYQGKEKHCGKCGACYERKEAFAKHAIPDPTEYEC